MAKKLKAVKCPQCGSEKHEQIDKKRYRCLNCGTEFFLDDDDININVNHHYDFQSSSTFGSDLGVGMKLGIVALLIPLAVVFIFVFFLFQTGESSVASGGKDSVSVRETFEEMIPMIHDGKACVFYMTDRDYTVGFGQDESKYVNGYYLGFRDATTGKVLVDQLFMSEEDARDESVSSISNTSISYLQQAHRWFLIIGKRYVFEIEPKSLVIKDVSKSLFKGKQAMSTGISSITFIDSDYGEGFEVHNNLAETYYYFPASNRLYSEEAFKFAKRLPPSELNGEVRDTTYWEMHKKNISEETSSAGGLLRLWKVHAKYHLGDPQDFSFYNWISQTFSYDPGNRLVSATPVTNWFIGFNGGVVYQDAQRLLITFYPSMAPDANSVFQMRDKEGNVLWTQALRRFSNVSVGACYGNKIWFLGQRSRRSGYDDIHSYSFDINTGKWAQGAQMSQEYSIKIE